MGRLFNLRSIIRLAVSLALLGFLLWRIDLERAAQELRDANYLFVLPALTLFATAKYLVARRWRLMMADFEVLPPLNFLFGVLLVSNLANNIVPARIGDLIRVQVPAERYGTSRARMTSVVFATESLLDGIALISLALIGLALVHPSGFPTDLIWAMLALLVFSLAAILPLSHVRLRQGWARRGVMARLPEKTQSLLDTAVPHLIDGLVVFKELRLAVPAIVLSFAIWLIETVMFLLFGFAFGIHLSFAAWLLVMVAANMISSLPITPSNIGTYELAVAELLRALGVDAGTAAGFAIAVHVFNIAWITAMGFAALWWLKLGLRDVFSFGPPPATVAPHQEAGEHALGAHAVRPRG